jgi:hypothetical protein
MDTRKRPQYRDKLKEYFDSIEDLRSPSQIINDVNERPKPRHGQWWGWWKYEEDNTLVLYKEDCTSYIYYIKLNECNTAWDITKICFEMIHKRWVDIETAGNLLIALCDIKQDAIEEYFKQNKNDAEKEEN